MNINDLEKVHPMKQIVWACAVQAGCLFFMFGMFGFNQWIFGH